VTVRFLAPSHVADHVLASVRALQTVFSQAFDVPSSWLDISMAEDTVTAAKAAVGQKLFVIVIEVAPAHYTSQLVAHIRQTLSDDTRLANLLAAAVPGASLVGSSIESSSPPGMPGSSVSPPPSTAVGLPPSTSAPHCKLCPAGFKCPAGSVQPVPCEQGTQQPNMGASECVKVSQVLSLGASNATFDDDLDTEESAITTEQEFVNNYLAIVIAVPAVLLVLCLLLTLGLCVWRRFKQQDNMKESSLREYSGKKNVNVLMHMEGEAPAPGDSDFRGEKKSKPRLELRKSEPRLQAKAAAPADTDADSSNGSEGSSTPGMLPNMSVRRSSFDASRRNSATRRNSDSRRDSFTRRDSFSSLMEMIHDGASKRFSSRRDSAGDLERNNGGSLRYSNGPAAPSLRRKLSEGFTDRLAALGLVENTARDSMTAETRVQRVSRHASEGAMPAADEAMLYMSKQSQRAHEV